MTESEQNSGVQPESELPENSQNSQKKCESHTSSSKNDENDARFSTSPIADAIKSADFLGDDELDDDERDAIDADTARLEREIVENGLETHDDEFDFNNLDKDIKREIEADEKPFSFEIHTVFNVDASDKDEFLKAVQTLREKFHQSASSAKNQTEGLYKKTKDCQHARKFHKDQVKKEIEKIISIKADRIEVGEIKIFIGKRCHEHEISRSAREHLKKPRVSEIAYPGKAPEKDKK